MESGDHHGSEQLKQRLSEKLAHQGLTPVTSAENITLAAAASGQAVWLGLETPASQLEDARISPNFTKEILANIFLYRQLNQDITTIYEWTGTKGPYTSAETQLIEKTFSLDKNLPFAEQMRPDAIHPDNNIRGPFLSTLIAALAHTESQKERINSPPPFTIQGAIISGPLNLEKHQYRAALKLAYCHLEKPINLNQAHLSELSLNACQLPALEARYAHIHGPVNLQDGFKATGLLNFDQASISGPFNAGGAILSPSDGAEPCLTLKGTILKAGLYLNNNFSAEGQIIATRLICHQDVDFSNAIITLYPNAESRSALEVEGAQIEGNLNLSGNFSAIGTVHLNGLRLDGSLTVTSGSFQNPYSESDQPALIIENSTIRNNVKLRYANILGALKINNLKLKGDLDLGNIACAGKLTSAGGTALYIRNSEIEGRLHLAESAIRGRVLIKHSIIGNSLDCTFSAFENLSVSEMQDTLSLENVAIGYHLKLAHGFNAKGHININNTAIKADLILTGGHFEGEVRLARTSIGGTFECDNPAEPTTRFHEPIRMKHTTATTLKDSKSSWPEAFIQQNFTYKTIAEGSTTHASERLVWLEKQNYNPKAYDILITAFGNSGKSHEALKLAREKAHKSFWDNYRKTINRRNRYGVLPSPFIQNMRTAMNWPPRALSWLIYGWLWQYGYGASRLVITAIALIIFGALIYNQGEHQGLIQPQNPAITLSDTNSECSPQQGGTWTRCRLKALPGFSPWVYSIDATIPIINLQQISHWQPRTAPFALDVPVPACLSWAKPCIKTKWKRISLGQKSLANLQMIQTLFGWLTLIGLLLFALKSRRT